MKDAKETKPKVTDNGPNPFAANIDKAVEKNKNYRTTLWTGEHLQVTLMTIQPKDDVGLEVHPDTDQFFRVEKGVGKVVMGDSKDNLTFKQKVDEDSVILIPANTWHNIINTGDAPLGLYSIYAPAHHKHGTVHKTKAEAEAEEAAEAEE